MVFQQLGSAPPDTTLGTADFKGHVLQEFSPVVATPLGLVSDILCSVLVMFRCLCRCPLTEYVCCFRRSSSLRFC